MLENYGAGDGDRTRHAFIVSRLCSSYEAVRNPKTAKKIAEVIDKLTHNSGLILALSPSSGPVPANHSTFYESVQN